MRCHSCGAEIPQGEWFCPACGQEVPPSDDYLAAQAAAAVVSEVEHGQAGDTPAHFAGTPSDESALQPDGADAEATVLVEAEEETAFMAEGPTQLVSPEGTTQVVGAGETVAVPSAAHAAASQVDDPPTMVAPAPVAAVESPAQRPYVPQPEPRPKRGVPKGLVIALAVLAVLAIAGFFAWQAYNSEMWGGKTLPDVVGKTLEEAQATLAEAGFASDVEEQYVDEGAGTVLRMDPGAGHRIPVSTRVSLVVGRQRSIPELLGLTFEEAKTQLERTGITNIRVEYRNSSADEGTVLEVTPAVGSTVTASDEVLLVVSQPFTVPDVVGRTEEDAVRAIEAAGLHASVNYVDSDLRAGTVITVTPEPGTKIGEGVTVELQVAKSGPDDIFDIASVYALPPAEVISFLEDQDFKLDVGYLGGDGSAFESLSRRDGVTYTFTPEPYSHHIGQWDFREPVDVMSSGSGFAGVRLGFPLSAAGISRTDASEATIAQVMGVCGLEGLARTYTKDTIVFPGKDDYLFMGLHTNFICGGGDAGDMVWTVLVNESLFDGPYATVTYAPRSLYDDIELADYDGSITDFVAYVDMFTE